MGEVEWGAIYSLNDFFSCYLQDKYKLAWLRGHRREDGRVFQAVKHTWKYSEVEKRLDQLVWLQ